MDEKTYDYMKDRVERYKAVRAKINSLKILVNRIEGSKGGDVSISIDGFGSYITDRETKDAMKFAMLNTAFAQIEVLEKQLAEI